jgi:hypothetical protein
MPMQMKFGLCAPDEFTGGDIIVRYTVVLR